MYSTIDSRVRRHLYHNQIVKEHQKQTSPQGFCLPAPSDRQGLDSAPIWAKLNPCLSQGSTRLASNDFYSLAKKLTIPVGVSLVKGAKHFF